MVEHVLDTDLASCVAAEAWPGMRREMCKVIEEFGLNPGGRRGFTHLRQLMMDELLRDKELTETVLQPLNRLGDLLSMSLISGILRPRCKGFSSARDKWPEFRNLCP